MTKDRTSRRTELEISLRTQLRKADLCSTKGRVSWLSQRLVEYTWRLQSAVATELFPLPTLINGDPGLMVEIALDTIVDESFLERAPSNVVRVWKSLEGCFAELRVNPTRQAVDELVRLTEEFTAIFENG